MLYYAIWPNFIIVFGQFLLWYSANIVIRAWPVVQLFDV